MSNNNSGYLIHYGVKGMEWDPSKRMGPPTSDPNYNRYMSNRANYNAKKNGNYNQLHGNGNTNDPNYNRYQSNVGNYYSKGGSAIKYDSQFKKQYKQRREESWHDTKIRQSYIGKGIHEAEKFFTGVAKTVSKFTSSAINAGKKFINKFWPVFK